MVLDTVIYASCAFSCNSIIVNAVITEKLHYKKNCTEIKATTMYIYSNYNKKVESPKRNLETNMSSKNHKE